MLTLLLLLGATPKVLDFEAAGLKRQMLVYPATKPTAGGSPVVFAFHGHGGGMRQAARSFEMQDAFPEAVVVYIQGLTTTGIKTDPEGLRSGWAITTTGDYADRDLGAFDAAYKIIDRDYKIDKKRVYAMGHSNGARFSWVLWAARPDKFAAFGPVSAPAGLFMRGAPKRPVFIAAGEKDQLVSYESMKLSIEMARRLLDLDVKPKTNGYLSYYNSHGDEMVTYIHPEGHKFPKEAVAPMVAFFKRHHL